jgi:hypothetical protein
MKNRVIARDPVIHGRPGQVGNQTRKEFVDALGLAEWLLG